MSLPSSQQAPISESPQTGKLHYHVALNILLFLLTFFTTTVAGVQWVGKNPFELTNLQFGLPYSIAILFVLGVHEFGHYFGMTEEQLRKARKA